MVPDSVREARESQGGGVGSDCHRHVEQENGRVIAWLTFVQASTTFN